MDTYIISKYGGVAEDVREASYRRTHAFMYVHVRICRALIRLVAAATIRERRLFRSALAQVRLLFESGVYSREASIGHIRYFAAAVCLTPAPAWTWRARLSYSSGVL